jgi:methionyl-tRNA formyltransferase
MKLIFMGTPDFAAAALAALLAAGHEVVAVYTQPPRPAQRGQKEQPSPVHRLALAQGLPLFTPRSLRDAAAQAEFAGHNADVAVVAAYGLILPQAVLDAPKRGCLNIHASLLPRWRGAAPIQRAIEAGDAQSGVCIMQMEAGLDTGPVLLEAAVPITAGMTAGDLHDALAAKGAALIVEALAQLDALPPRPQPADGVTYAKKIDKAEARLDWQHSAATLERRIRAFNPVPGAYAELPDGERLKILAATIVPGSGAPGTVVDDQLTIACGDGQALRPLQLQRPGKRAMAADEALRGFHIPIGTRLP